MSLPGKKVGADGGVGPQAVGGVVGHGGDLAASAVGVIRKGHKLLCHRQGHMGWVLYIFQGQGDLPVLNVHTVIAVVIRARQRTTAVRSQQKHRILTGLHILAVIMDRDPRDLPKAYRDPCVRRRRLPAAPEAKQKQNQKGNIESAFHFASLLEPNTRRSPRRRALH